MEETKTEDLQADSRKNWVKFEDEEETGKAKTDATDPQQLKSVEENGPSGPAVLPIDSVVHSVSTPIHNGADNSSGSAVIDATQVYLNVDQKRATPRETKSMSTVASPHPTPAPRNLGPSAVNRSVSTPTGPASSASSTPVAGTVPPPPRPESVIHAGTPRAPAFSSQPPQRPPGPRLQNIPLRDSAGNGVPSARPPHVTAVNLRQDSFNFRQGFANGDVIVSLFPVNERFPWLTPASFRPELVPEELMAEGLTLTVEEYVASLELLVNDVRFNCYNICYKRILLFWILFGFVVLLGLLFSGQRGLGLFGGGVVWLFLNATGIFVCMWLKMRMSRHLERCLAAVNKLLWKHKILLGLDDKGKLSCHKVNLIFVYFDCTDCVKRLNEVIDVYDKEPADDQPKTVQPNIRSRMDIDDSDIIITGSANTRVSRKQERAEKLLLRYSQRWVKEYTRHRLDLNVDVHDRAEGEPPAAPRHCVHARCPCQFIEEHLKYKPRGKFCGCQLFNF